MLAAFIAAWRALAFNPSLAGQTLSAAVVRGDLNISVTTKGSLESQKTFNGVCEVAGHQNKIISIVNEGAVVKKGEEVVRFDSKEIDQNIAQQEIKAQQAEAKVVAAKQEWKVQVNKAESEVLAADLERELAALDLLKYEEGDFLADQADLRGKIALDKFNAQETRQKVDQFRILVKKGFRTDEQLRGLEEDAKQWEFNLERDEQKLQVLKTYEYKRKVTEFRAKVAQAGKKVERSKDDAIAQAAKFKSEYEAAKSTAALERRLLGDYQEQRKRCTISAGQPGVVAYANQEWWDDSRRIREGAMVYFRQTVFTLPDMTQMLVSAKVHEAVVKKVKAGQKVDIRVDAFPNLLIPGTVQQVSLLADSQNSWRSGNVKEYPVKILVDKMPAEPLKPGMSAEVIIHVNTIEDALAAPIQAVVERERKHYAYVASAGDFVRREVTIGENTEREVQILTGLELGDRVALDARKRSEADFGPAESYKPKDKVEKPAASRSSP